MESDNTTELEYIKMMLDDTMRRNYTGTDQSYELWFSRMQLRKLDNEKAYFVCENEMKRKIITEKFITFIRESLSAVIGYDAEIDLSVDTSLAPVIKNESGVISPLELLRLREEQEKTAATEAEEEPDTDDFDEDASETGERRLRYNEDYTFENFIVGNSNRFAHAAALNVANNLSGKASPSANPLFIWGPSGLGKTHLMYAIANRVLKNDPSRKVIYVKGEEFMIQLIDAIQTGKTREFRAKYRKADMLLIDDIQYIAGADSTQREFFHTFDALYEEGKQIIITSDRPPKDLTSLVDRIKSRFESGLLADIQPPDYELRLAILRDKIHKSQLTIDVEVIDFLAKSLQENIRQLEGVVKKLAMANIITGNDVDMTMVLNTVPEYLRDTVPVTDTIDRIIECVGRSFSVTVEDIKGTQKKKNIKDARNVAMYIIQEETDLSLKQIGDIFGRDHSTVHSNINRAKSDMANDPVFDTKVKEIEKEVKRKA